MGASAAKPAPLPTAPVIDINRATFGGDYVQQLQAQAGAAVKTLTTTTASASWTATVFKYVSILFAISTLVFGGILIYDVIAQKFGWRTIFLDGAPTNSGGGNTPTPPPPSPPTPIPPSTILYIQSATYTSNADSTKSADVTNFIRSRIVGETTLPGFIVTETAVGLTPETDPDPANTKTLSVDWFVGYNSSTTTKARDNSPFPTLPTYHVIPVSPSGPVLPPVGAGATARTPSLLSSLLGGGSGDLMRSSHDATQSLTIPASNAPLSSQTEGSYGMQFWMFIKDWNYSYGKEKPVVIRSDPTNRAISNPRVYLHPTDNSMKIMVSVFPTNGGGGSSKTQPAPHGSSGSQHDDVFICEVPNLPLQTWFSVGITVFDRNLDIYIDGKLVKSCFLSGVPKPAAGDLEITPNGGFSGTMCGFYHYPNMLKPTDASNFFAAGTSCRSSSDPTVLSKTTGYNIKFGVYDTLGKEVSEYSW
jgi:hypothetical protein